MLTNENAERFQLTGTEKELSKMYWTCFLTDEGEYTIEIDEFHVLAYLNHRKRHLATDTIRTHTFFLTRSPLAATTWSGDNEIKTYDYEDWKKEFPQWAETVEMVLLRSLL